MSGNHKIICSYIWNYFIKSILFSSYIFLWWRRLLLHIMIDWYKIEKYEILFVNLKNILKEFNDK